MCDAKCWREAEATHFANDRTRPLSTTRGPAGPQPPTAEGSLLFGQGRRQVESNAEVRYDLQSS